MENRKSHIKEVQERVIFMNETQVNFIQSIGLTKDTPMDIIEDRVAKYLETKGFDRNYRPTAEGLICESILDLIGDTL
jgi:hypothetical protein